MEKASPAKATNQVNDMGSFNTNCCLTGLAITRGDPIRAALLVPNGDLSSCYAGSSYLFWTPPVQSEYDDYGNLEWNDIPQEQKTVLEFILKIIKPALEDKENYSRGFFDKGEPELRDIWTACIRDDIVLDPKRKIRNANKVWIDGGRIVERTIVKEYMQGDYQAMHFKPWMCHDWAWDELLKMGPDEENPNLTKAIDNFFITYKVICDRLDKEFGTTKPRSDLYMDAWWEATSRDNSWLYGDQGSFDVRLALLVRDLHSVNPECHHELLTLIEPFKQMLRDTSKVVRNMYYIRKSIMPTITVGEQYEQWEYLKPWTKLIADKAAEIVANIEY